MAIEMEIPALYGTDGEDTMQKMLYEKYFLPGTRWTWFVAEVDDNKKTAYGFVVSGLDTDYDEWGYFDLEELETLSVPNLPLGVEKDKYFTPKQFCELKPGIDYPEGM